jgi:alpha-tubulin suppressor-like RCC1 family protein
VGAAEEAERGKRAGREWQPRRIRVQSGQGKRKEMNSTKEICSCSFELSSSFLLRFDGATRACSVVCVALIYDLLLHVFFYKILITILEQLNFTH